MTTAHAMAGTLLHAGSRPLATRHGTFTLHVCRDLGRRTYVLVAARGDVRGPEPLVARVHSSCVTSEGYGGCDCDCAEQLDAALAAIAAVGRGAVFYLDQEGRGAGFAAKVRDRMLVQASGSRLNTFDAYAELGLAADLRVYDAVAAARTLLDVTAPLRLLTNNPDKLATLATLGVPLAGSLPLELAASPFNHHYLAAKAQAGHRLTGIGPARDAEPPAPLVPTAPHAVEGAPHLVALGSYWLPVRTGDGAEDHSAEWFRLHAYADLATTRERVVLTHGDPARGTPLVRVQSEAVVERFPRAEAGEQKRRWQASIRAFVATGGGVAVMTSDESATALLGAAAPEQTAGVDATTIALLAHHLAGKRAVPLVDGPAVGPADAARATALAARGIALASPRFLAG